MTTWDAFYSLVRPVVQGCPISYVDSAIRAAAIEFCEKSLIWNQETICGDLLAGEQVYKYNPNSDGIQVVMPRAVILRGVQPDGTPKDHHVENTNLQDLDTYDKDWRLKEEEWPTKFYMKDPNTLVFVEKPTVTHLGAVHLLTAVKPRRDSAGVADFIYEDWAETIAAGALARLLMMVSRPWGNAALVPAYRSEFRAGISRAKSKMYKSWTAQSKFMKPINFKTEWWR